MEKNNNTEKKIGSTNYELKSRAVEELLEAEAGVAPEYSQEELGKYRAKSKLYLPEVLKVLLIKGWFAGAVCFFFFWGLSTYMNYLDLMFITAIVMGMVTDILVNNVLRFMEKEKGANDRWMMYPKKGMMSFFLNIIHGFAMMLCIYLIYYVIGFVATAISGEETVLGVEPILFGVFYVVCDVLFITIKRALMALVRKLVDRK